MIRTKAILITALLACSAGILLHANESANKSPAAIWLAEIRGTINPASSSYFQKTIARAEKDRAGAVILELDTPGGLLTSVRDMTQAMDRSTVPVVIYVSPAGASATSAGALLMLGSHVAAMASGTNIGAAHPVGAQGEEIKGSMGEKATNDTAAFARGMAELKGRNAELANEIVSKSKSLTAEEALKQRVIEIVANSRADLFKKLDGYQIKIKGETRSLRTEGAEVKTAEMTPGQTLLHYLANPNVAGLLMTLGILLIYVELSAPGMSIPGVLGGICILVALMSFELLPIRAGGLVLLIAGALMLLAEPFVTSHGALAVGGIISFILGLIWVIDPSRTSLQISSSVWIPAGIVLGIIVVSIGYFASRINTLSQRALAEMGGGGVSGLSGYHGVVESVEADGRRGKAAFRGELWNFESESPVKPGDAVEATRATGMTIQVRRRSELS
ncbi:MAG TPA: nodulation protein NfeD [Bdellovibrionota bacterium]|nr:nodulation protein NfeD [Bdellovibrionota bacterium]